MEPFQNPAVQRVFDAYPDNLKARLQALRELIYSTAADTEGVGQLEETLKWGQPSYLTPKTKSGTTIRIDRIGKAPNLYGMFVHCQTSLISTYRDLFSDALVFDGDRGIALNADQEMPEEILRNCIELALTYHKSKIRAK